MVPALFFYQLVLVALAWVCLMLHWVWPSDCATAHPTPPPPTPLRRQRSREPKPFAGLTTKPPCDACAHASAPHPQAPSAPATPHRPDTGAPPLGRHLDALLSEPGLCLSGLGRL